MALRLLFLLSFLLKAASGGNIVTTLPGYNKTDLPFTLETGYVGVGENEDVQLFYYFVESQGNPTEDPLLLYLTGGPGYSTVWAFFYEFGPLLIDRENYKYDGSLPTLVDNQYAWTKYFNIIFLDGPVGTGFSYSKSEEGSLTGDYIFAAHLREFINKWLVENPKFTRSELYIGGDGYSGMPIPILLKNITDDPQFVNLKGYVLVGPGADLTIDFNARYTYANGFGFIPDRLYEAAKSSCNGNFFNGTQNKECESNMAIMNELIRRIHREHVMENSCKDVDIPPILPDINLARRSLKEQSRIFLNSLSDSVTPKMCRKVYRWICSNTWANDEEVRKALHIQPGTKPNWEFYNVTVDDTTYSKDVTSVISYHKDLSNTNLRGLIFSGDHDMDISPVGTQQWIWSLNLTLVESWRSWSVNNETAGYMRKFSNGDFSLTFALVKGGGHFVQEFKPYESYELMERWLANKPL